MIEIAQALNQTGALALAWRQVAWTFVAYLFVLGILIFPPRQIAKGGHGH